VGDAPGCTVATESWDAARVSCDHPVALVRRVQYEPGWTAEVDGASVPVTEDHGGPAGLFQTVTVPPGTHRVTFTYLPPLEGWAVPVAVVAWLALAASWVVTSHRRRAGMVTAPVSGGVEQLARSPGPH